MYADAGQVLAQHWMRHGEDVSSLHIWHTSTPLSVSPARQLAPEQQLMAEAAAATGGVLQGGAELHIETARTQAHGQAVPEQQQQHPKEDQHGAGQSQEWAEPVECPLIVVGSKDRGSHWSPCKGRLLTLRLVTSATGGSTALNACPTLQCLQCTAVQYCNCMQCRAVLHCSACTHCARVPAVAYLWQLAL